jgi:putative ABC transport system substrate-binding protein
MAKILLVVAAICLGAAHAAAAQPRIGVLSFPQITDQVKRDFTAALREEGLVEGRDIRIEWRSADGRADKAKEMAQELVRLRVDVIVAMLTPAVQAARDATSTIPVVMAASGAAHLFVQSLARPGGNVTGVAGFGAELSGKRIELARELVPGIRRIGLLTNSSDPFAKTFVGESREAAQRQGVELVIVDVKRPEEVDAAYASLKASGAGVVIVQGVLTSPAWQGASLAIKHGLPAMSFAAAWAPSGGLINYTGSTMETYRRGASYVKRILNGAKAAELPVERPTRTELIINLKTARALGLTVPPSLLVKADQLID